MKQVEQKKINGQPRNVITAYVYDLGGLSDDKKTKYVRDRLLFVVAALLLARGNPDGYGVLYLTYNTDIDYIVIRKAIEGLSLKGLNLTGVKFFFYGRADERARFEPLIMAAGADFIFIDKTK